MLFDLGIIITSVGLFAVDHIQFKSAGFSLNNDFFAPVMTGKYTDILYSFP